MLKSKHIRSLEKRLSDLEKQVLALAFPQNQSKNTKENGISYEEVIKEWLCGKEQS